MGSSRLESLVPVTVGAGATLPFAHGITDEGRDVRPNIVMPVKGTALIVTFVDELVFTVMNPTAAPITTAFFCELEHSVQHDPIDDAAVTSYWQGLESTGGGSGMAIGGLVTGGTPGRVLFVGAGSVLAEDAGFTYDSADDVLRVAGAYQLDNNAAVPVSAVGSVRLRANAGVLEVSQNGSAYQAIDAVTTLAEAYNNGGAGPQVIALSALGLGVLVRDNAVPIGATLFGVQDGGGADILVVDTSGVRVRDPAGPFNVMDVQVATPEILYGDPAAGLDFTLRFDHLGGGIAFMSANTSVTAGAPGVEFDFRSGDGAAANGVTPGGLGGAFMIRGGAGGAGSGAQAAGAGDALLLVAGAAGVNGGGGGAAGGVAQLEGGAATGTGAGGDLNLFAGGNVAGTGQGGVVVIRGGSSTTAGGSVELITGSMSAPGTPGNVFVILDGDTAGAFGYMSIQHAGPSTGGVADMLLVSRNASSGPPVVGFGAATLWRLTNDLNATVDAGRLQLSMTSVSAGAETSEWEFQTVDAGGALTAALTISQTSSSFAGDLTVNGKLTVTGAIDPTSLTLVDGGSAAYIENAAGSATAVSPASRGRLRYNEGTQAWQLSANGAAYVNVATGSGMAIGGAITGGTATRVLFEAAGPVLADDADLTWDTATNTLSATNVSTTAVTDSGLTATRVTFAGVGGLLSDDAGMFYTAATDLLNLAGGLELANSALAVSAAASARLRSSGGNMQLSNSGGAYADLATTAYTLQQAYNAGAASPTTITLDATRDGVVFALGAANANPLLGITDGASSASFNAPSIAAATLITGVTSDAVAGITNVLSLTHTNPGAAIDGIGTGILFRAKDDGGTMEDIGSIAGWFADNAAASEDSAISFYLRSAGSGAVERFRFTTISPIGNDNVPTLQFLSPSSTGLTHIQTGTGGVSPTTLGRFVFTTSLTGASTQTWYQFTNDATNTSLVGNFLEVLAGSTAVRFAVGKPYGITIGSGGAQSSPVSYLSCLDSTNKSSITAGDTSVWGYEFDLSSGSVGSPTTYSHDAGTGAANKRQFVIGLANIAGTGAGTSWASYTGLDVTTIQASVSTNTTNVGIVSTVRIGTESVNVGTSNAAWAYRDLNVPDKTLTVGGGTASTVAVTLASVFIGQVTLTDATAVTQPLAASLYVKGAPIAAGLVTLTESFAFVVDDGTSRFDGQILASDGTAAAPSYAFQGASSNTGFFRQAVDVVGLSVNGTERFRWNSTGTGEYIPPTDNQGSIGTAANRWALVRANVITSGDIGFDDQYCARCGEEFQVDDELVLKVHKVKRDTEGRRVSYSVPMHTTCKRVAHAA